MNIILITAGTRGALLRQTIETMRANAEDWKLHSLTVVMDGCAELDGLLVQNTTIINHERRGASASRNIGAGSIPKKHRHQHVMFCDDDVYFIHGWDTALMNALDSVEVASPCAHPFNLPTGFKRGLDYAEVLSTVAMAMHWFVFDECGHWDEPGGSGGSEDVAFCRRASAEDYTFGVLNPQRAIHCGLTSSTGNPIVGTKELADLNHSIIMANCLQGKVLQQ
jgi:hypothetical protein